MDIQFAHPTPGDPGFVELRTQSMAEGFNILRRLEENWLSGNSFKLLSLLFNILIFPAWLSPANHFWTSDNLTLSHLHNQK